MEDLIAKYVDKLDRQGLSAPEETLLGFLDDTAVWSRSTPATRELQRVFGLLAVNSLLLARPQEPYRTIIDCLAAEPGEAITPNDSETRTFLHDIPIVRELSAETIAAALSRRKCAILPDHGIVTAGSVSPEQTFIHFSSVCFASFVTFFSELLESARSGDRIPRRRREAFAQAVSLLPEMPGEKAAHPYLVRGPFLNEAAVIAAMDQAGKEVVRLGLVDSFFGNISYRLDNTIYISQTSSSLDELPGCIDPCPVDGSSTAAVTASSELSAHKDILAKTGCLAVLHGHPKFSVIMSMLCEVSDCELRGECHRRCPRERSVCGFPIVSGEVGTGPFGLCRTVPDAILANGAAIVFGHGVFTTGRQDFTDALARLVHVESACREDYFRHLKGMLP